MTPLEALLLGILEGLTEFLPVSSTGHLILLGSRLGHEDEAAKTLAIVIQLGAVLAVIVYYRKLLLGHLRGLLAREPASFRLFAALVIAFFPAALLGLAFHKLIKEKLFGPVPVAIALVVGGVVMIISDFWVKRRKGNEVGDLAEITPKRALAVGLAQCFSLWPGASRSMTTILGGQVVGLSTATAAEFSFLLSIPVLGAATVYDMYKGGAALLSAPGGALSLAVGLGAAFFVSLAVIAVFIRYLKRFGLMPFGVYRILLGALVLFVATH